MNTSNDGKIVALVILAIFVCVALVFMTTPSSPAEADARTEWITVEGLHAESAFRPRAVLKRRVPGGWIYWMGYSFGTSSVFVPDPGDGK